MKICRKASEQLFPNRRPLSYPNWTKNMNTHIRLKQHKNSTPKHKTTRTTTEVSPWNDIEDIWSFNINFTASTPPSKFNIHKCHTSKMCLVGTYFYTNVKLKIKKKKQKKKKKKTVQQGYHPCREHQHVIGMVLVPVNQFKFMLPASGCLNFLISRNISDILKREKEIYKNDC